MTFEEGGDATYLTDAFKEQMRQTELTLELACEWCFRLRAAFAGSPAHPECMCVWCNEWLHEGVYCLARAWDGCGSFDCTQRTYKTTTSASPINTISSLNTITIIKPCSSMSGS